MTKRKTKDHRIGQRVEIGAHLDAWMRGARFGVVRSVYNTHRLGSNVTFLAVRMDHTGIRRLMRIRETDVAKWFG